MDKHYMFCISGFSGSGKDEFARHLVEKHNTIKIGLVDSAKRHLADLYNFTEEQLFGPSIFRNNGDIRYPKYNVKDIPVIEVMEEIEIKPGDPRFWLSPREALQIYCEKMNELYLNTWIEKAIRTHSQLAKNNHIGYTPMKGLVPLTQRENNEYGVFTCCCDIRHKHEINTIRAMAGVEGYTPVIIRIKRDGLTKPPYNHRSEVEQSTIPDRIFDFVVYNDGRDIASYHDQAEGIVKLVTNDFSPKLDTI